MQSYLNRDYTCSVLQQNGRHGHYKYHIFKLIILVFGFIMMFDTSMFLLSFDTDWVQTTLVENIGLNAV